MAVALNRTVDRGCSFVDAPVSGGVGGAEASETRNSHAQTLGKIIRAEDRCWVAQP